MYLFKITKSLIITVILLSTFSALAIVSHASAGKASFTIGKGVSNNGKSKPKAKKKIAKVIKTARSYIGTTYKYGGFSRSGMDCSGLMCTAFKAVDIQLPRTSGEQSQSGKTIAREDIKPGDLVFFTDKKGNKKITHVGLVTEVKGSNYVKFIHSSTKLGVVEDNLYADYYIAVFIKAVRVF